MAKEKLQVFDRDLTMLNKYIYRGENNTLDDGEFISVSILFNEYNNKYLLEKRSVSKNGKYGAVGGHTSYQEEPIDSIIRETYEEIGYSLNKKDIKLLGLIKRERFIASVYYSNLNIDINSLKLQTEEVEDVVYLSKSEIIEEIKKGNVSNVTSEAFIKYI